jgi:penicillin-binding protein 2
VIGVVTLALFSALFARLWYLQVAAAGDYAAAAVRNAVREVPIPAPRGRILDVHGRVLVDNRVADVITVSRRISPADRRLVVARLAELLAVEPARIRARLDDPRISPYAPVPVAVDVPYETLAYVAERRRDFPGVEVRPVAMRRYLHGPLAAHVLGYVGEINEEELRAQPPAGRYTLGDTIGKAGVERTFESELRGRPGRERVEVDARGRVLRTLDTRRPRAGRDVRLTIDLDVQRAAEEALAQAIASARATRDTSERRRFRRFAAPGGSVVVLDARSGAVVALASSPSYDPNLFVNGIPTPTWQWLNDPAHHYPLLNRAVGGQYAPGSTYKPIAAVAGLLGGVITPNTTIRDRGRYSYPTDPDRYFTNDGGASYGAVDLRRALTVSSDVYFYTIGGDLYARQRRGLPGGDALQTVPRVYGFGEPTGVPLPDEAPGRVPDAGWKRRVHEQRPDAFPYPDWLPGDNIQSAIGQGDVLATPIQLANAYAAIANGGTLFEPRLAEEVVEVDGSARRALTPIVRREVPVPGREVILAGLRGAVEQREGTAARVFAGFPAGLVAGKTGTAQVAGRQSTSLFVALTPAAEPRWVVAAVVEEAGYGAATAAPIVRRVIEALHGLPPTPVVVVPPPRGN